MENKKNNSYFNETAELSRGAWAKLENWSEKQVFEVKKL